MIPVSSLDAAMLYAETPEMPMHTMGVLILEPEASLDADDHMASAFDSPAFCRAAPSHSTVQA